MRAARLRSITTRAYAERQCRMELSRGVLGGEVRSRYDTSRSPACKQLLLVDDVVSVKHRAGLVAGQQHRDTFWNSGPHEVLRSSRRSSKRSRATLKCTSETTRWAGRAHWQ